MHTSFPSYHPNSFSLLPSNHLTIMFHQADLICSIQLPASDQAALYLSSVKLIGTQEKNNLTQAHYFFFFTHCLHLFCSSIRPPVSTRSSPGFSPLPHLTFLILKPRSLTVPCSATARPDLSVSLSTILHHRTQSYKKKKKKEDFGYGKDFKFFFLFLHRL